MDTKIKQAIEECVAASHAGTRHFADIVGALVAHGVESYRVDFRQRSSTYFLPTGDWHSVPIATPELAIAEAFDTDTLLEAIRGAQRGEVLYPEFIERALRAGCVGYVVWLAGRHVAYFGRRGETHVERFPSRPT